METWNCDVATAKDRTRGYQFCLFQGKTDVSYYSTKMSTIDRLDRLDVFYCCVVYDKFRTEKSNRVDVKYFRMGHVPGVF